MTQITIFIMIITGLLALDEAIQMIAAPAPGLFLKFIVLTTASCCSFWYLKTEENS